MSIRLLLVDDHADFLAAIVAIVSGGSDVQVVGEAMDGLSAIQLVRQVDPHVVVMDVQMPGMTGIETTRVIRDRHPDVSVVGLSSRTDQWTVRRMLLAGANGYVDKFHAHAELLHAVRRAHAGDVYLSDAIAATGFEL